MQADAAVATHATAGLEQQLRESAAERAALAGEVERGREEVMELQASGWQALGGHSCCVGEEGAVMGELGGGWCGAVAAAGCIRQGSGGALPSNITRCHTVLQLCVYCLL